MTPFVWANGAPHHPQCADTYSSPAVDPAKTNRKCGGCGGSLSKGPKGGKRG